MKAFKAGRWTLEPAVDSGRFTGAWWLEEIDPDGRFAMSAIFVDREKLRQLRDLCARALKYRRKTTTTTPSGSKP